MRLLSRLVGGRHRHPCKVGLALGSGSIRGLAHIGVIKALAEAGIPIDCIAGTSAGAVVGAVYASAGLNGLLDVASTVSIGLFTRPTLSMRGLASSAMIESFVAKYVGEKTFLDLSIPFTAVAADLRSGREVFLNAGPVARAARASAGFVALFAPIEIHGMYLVDGGVCCAAPVAPARGMGADLVIAVDVVPNVVISEFPETVFGIVTRTLDLLIKKAEQPALKDADFVIEPVTGTVGSFDVDSAESLVKMGEAAAAPVIPAIRSAIAKW